MNLLKKKNTLLTNKIIRAKKYQRIDCSLNIRHEFRLLIERRSEKRKITKCDEKIILYIFPQEKRHKSRVSNYSGKGKKVALMIMFLLTIFMNRLFILNFVANYKSFETSLILRKIILHAYAWLSNFKN